MLRHLLKSEEFLKENSDHVTVPPKPLQWWFPALEMNPRSYRGVGFACSGPSFLSSGISTTSLQPHPIPIQPHQPLASRQRCFPSSWCPPCPSPCPSISAGSPSLSSCWSWLKRHLHGEVSPKPLINVGSPSPRVSFLSSSFSSFIALLPTCSFWFTVFPDCLPHKNASSMRARKGSVLFVAEITPTSIKAGGTLQELSYRGFPIQLHPLKRWLFDSNSHSNRKFSAKK